MKKISLLIAFFLTVFFCQAQTRILKLEDGSTFKIFSSKNEEVLVFQNDSTIVPIRQALEVEEGFSKLKNPTFKIDHAFSEKPSPTENKRILVSIDYENSSFKGSCVIRFGYSANEYGKMSWLYYDPNN